MGSRKVDVGKIIRKSNLGKDNSKLTNMELEARSIVDLKKIASELTEDEINLCGCIALEVSEQVKTSPEFDTDLEAGYNPSKNVLMPNNCYGIKCAASSVRNYFFSLMTANAVKYSKKFLGKSPVLVEMGMGSGLNCIAALLVDPNARIIGFEKDPKTIALAERMFDLFGVDGKVEKRQENFLEASLDCEIDVVVNENLSRYLIGEPLFLASNHIHTYCHKKTLFIPSAIDVFINNEKYGKVEKYFIGRIDLSKIVESPIVLSHKFEPGQLGYRNRLDVEYHLCDFKNDSVVSTGRCGEYEIDLNLSHMLLHSDPLDPKSEHTLTLQYFFNRGKVGRFNYKIA